MCSTSKSRGVFFEVDEPVIPLVWAGSFLDRVAGTYSALSVVVSIGNDYRTVWICRLYISEMAEELSGSPVQRSIVPDEY